LAELNVELKNPQATKGYLEKIQILSPGSSEVDILRGDILFIEKRTPEAIESYKLGLKKSFKTTTVSKVSRRFLMADEHDKAVSFIKEWMNSYPGDLNLSLALTDIYRQMGNANLAIEECKRIQKHQTENIWILHHLAQLYENIDNEKAYSFARRAYDIGSDSPKITSTYNHLAATY
jgi:tetratricopeptide (TPR) repeat protein